MTQRMIELWKPNFWKNVLCFFDYKKTFKLLNQLHTLIHCIAHGLNILAMFVNVSSAYEQ